MMSPSNEGKIWSPNEKGQILNTTGARRLQISRKYYRLDNMCPSGLTLDKSTSISSNKEMREEQRAGISWIITGKRGERFGHPDGREANCPQEEALRFFRGS